MEGEDGKLKMKNEKWKMGKRRTENARFRVLAGWREGGYADGNGFFATRESNWAPLLAAVGRPRANCQPRLRNVCRMQGTLSDA